MLKQKTQSVLRVFSASCSLLFILTALCGLTRAQSTDPTNPTPITSGTSSGQAGPAGATYYYRFNAAQGSVKITLKGQTNNYSTQFEADVLNMDGTDLGDIYVSAGDAAKSESKDFSFANAQPVNIVVKLTKDSTLKWQKYSITLSGAVGVGNSGGGGGNKDNTSPSLPDLKVTDVQIHGNNGNRLTITISNSCNGDVPASSLIRLQLFVYENADKKKIDLIFAVDQAPLAGNTSSTYILDLSQFNYSLKSFDHKYLRVEVDPGNKIKEASESNNWWETGAAPFPEKNGYCNPKSQ
ncbi:MAG: hypothetical protein DMF68_18165 [Acidobacteria bacterium]|nr:MAG: hypothetical protein DMF68_18165 [Acidobacteriota bacterium]